MRLTEISPKIITAVAGGAVLILLILLVIGLLPKPKDPPKVSATSPSNEEGEVLGALPITIIFEEGLEKDEQDDISITSSPEASFAISWVSQNQLQLKPTEILQGGVGYTLVVRYREDPIYSFSFTTVDIDPKQLLEDISRQAEGDRLFSEAQKSFVQDNPWYVKLPIVTDNYTIVYDTKRGAIRIGLTIEDDLSEGEKESVRSTAISELEKIGVDITTQDYYFLE